MPRGHYDRHAARARRETAQERPFTRATVTRDENWGKRTRKIKGEVNYRELISPDEIPGDACYQWKSLITLGKIDENKFRLLAENGWSPVPHSRHPYMPKEGDNIVDRDAMLMEQPIELYEEARDSEQRAHLDQMNFGRQSLTAAPPSTFERRDLGTNVKVAPVAVSPDDSGYQREVE